MMNDAGYSLPRAVGAFKQVRKPKTFMIKLRTLPTVGVMLSLLTSVCFADDAKAPAAAPVAANAGTNSKPDTAAAAKPAKQSQSELASKTAAFAKVSKTNEAFTAALDAHELAAGLKQT